MAIANIPQSQMLDANGNLSQEWLIFFNQIKRAIDKLEAANTTGTP